MTTTRRPLVIVAGQLRQLPNGDTISAALMIPHGTAFPSAPSPYDRYFRDDLGVDFFYDGTRWIGPPCVASFTSWNGYPPYNSTDSPVLLAVSGPIFIDLFELHYYISIGNASNYWIFELTRDSTATIWTDATDDRPLYNNDFAITNLGAQTPTGFMRLRITKIGSPSAINISATMTYRRIY